MVAPKKTFRSPSAGSETGPGRGLGNSSARNTGGIEGSGSKNVSKVNKNGSAAPVGTGNVKVIPQGSKPLTPRSLGTIRSEEWDRIANAKQRLLNIKNGK
jgi:hypothetical protein